MIVARTQTIVQLNEDLVAQLDDEAARRGQSRSALIRDALTVFLADRRRDDIGRRIVEGYERIPSTAPDQWGDVSGVLERGTGETLQRLDEEERAAGHHPW